MKTLSSRRVTSLAVCMVLLASVSTTFAIPVFDLTNFTNNKFWYAKLEATKWAVWIKELEQWREQIRQTLALYEKAKETLDYTTLRDGNWKSVLAKLPGEQTDEFCKGVIDLDSMGWKLSRERWAKVAEARSALAALREMRAVMDAKAPRANVRENTEKIWGVVPMTIDGVRVESMHQELATVIAGVAQMQKAIEEKRENIDQLDKEISGAFGFRTPVEVDRLQVKQDREQSDLNSLQLQSSNYTNRLLIQMVGNEAAKVTNGELLRLRGQAEFSTWMRGVRFSPRIDPSLRGGVE